MLSRIVRCLLLTVLVGARHCGGVEVAQAADISAWNQFRGPTADGRAPSPRLPVHWSEQENVRWKTAIAGKAWSSPVVADGTIWLTNATEDGRRLSVVAIDAATGRKMLPLLHRSAAGHQGLRRMWLWQCQSRQ